MASDVDLLVVYGGPERDDAYALCKKTMGVPRLEPHVYSRNAYEEMKQTIDCMMSGGVVLFCRQEYDDVKRVSIEHGCGEIKK